jgi:hypothetical protein
LSACADAVRLRLSDAQSAAAVQAVLVAGNHLQPQHVLALAEQLCKFPALKQLDASANPRLDSAFLSLIGKALSSEAVLLQHHCVFSLRHQHLPRVLTVLQELHILLSSTSAALASRACPMILCSICLVFNV